MIFVFHTLYFLVKLAFKIYKQQKSIEDFKQINQENFLQLSETSSFKDKEDDLKFDPPVYRQRYSQVQMILLDHQWRRDIKKIVDFGCAEFKFFQYLKNLFSIQNVIAVDIDQELLEENKYKLQPLTVDYLKTRTDPFSVSIYCGSVSDPDENLKDVDAVIGIELIEHLYPDTLEALPYNIFGFIKPKIAIFTTPNADFNILFPNFKGFRHPDHKFEWTRIQFVDWANNITVRFPEYTVKFEGVGEGPKGTESLGCCSQMAIFVREFESVSQEVPEMLSMKDIKYNESFGICTYYSYIKQIESLQNLKDLKKPEGFYKLIEHIEYPFTADNRTADEKILHEAMNIIYRNLSVYSRFFNEETQCVEIPLYEICTNVDGQFVMEKELRHILEEADFTVKECILYGCDEPDLCVVQDINMDQQSSLSSNEDRTEQQVDHSLNCSNETESDWECSEPKETKKTSPETSNAEPSEKLFDSGYQKSNPEWSPQSPIPDGLFEEHYNNYAVDVNDIKERVNKKLDLSLKTINNKTITESKSPGCSHLKSPQNLPGTSEVFKRKKKKHPDDEESIKSEVKNIAHCIMYNSLNKLNLDEEIAPNEDFVPLEAPEAPFIVENGDLANNNRDNEGNNYPEVPEPEPFIVDDAADEANENRVAFDNPEAGPADNQNQNLPHPVVPLVDYEDDVDEGIDVVNETIEPEEVNHASREALFDPDSQLDMLEEYSIPDVTDEPSDEPVLIGVNLIAEENDDVNPFPNWLLQLLGQQGEDDIINHDEPHFYCQGDGLGVHPSIIEVDVDESSSDTSSNDDAQAEAISEEDINPPLPTDVASLNAPALEVVGHSMDVAIPLHITQSVTSTDSTDEFFDTIDDICPGTNKN